VFQLLSESHHQSEYKSVMASMEGNSNDRLQLLLMLLKEMFVSGINTSCTWPGHEYNVRCLQQC
jgi:hypothetical protein